MLTERLDDVSSGLLATAVIMLVSYAAGTPSGFVEALGWATGHLTAEWATLIVGVPSTVANKGPGLVPRWLERRRKAGGATSSHPRRQDFPLFRD